MTKIPVLLYQAFEQNSLYYLAVGDTYTFNTTATTGTNVTVVWLMEDTTNVTNTYPGELVLRNFDYAFKLYVFFFLFG